MDMSMWSEMDPHAILEFCRAPVARRVWRLLKDTVNGRDVSRGLNFTVPLVQYGAPQFNNAPLDSSRIPLFCPAQLPSQIFHGLPSKMRRKVRLPGTKSTLTHLE